jgi:hypothetical protein
MDIKKSEEIQSYLKEVRANAVIAFSRQVRKIYHSAEHPAFIPENLVRKAVRAADANARQLLADAVEEVSEISTDPEAYAMIDQTIAVHLSHLEDEVAQGKGLPLRHSMLKVAGELFAAVREGLRRSQEIHRPTFTGSKNKGGARDGFDWKGAKAYVMKKSPNGLPKGRGAAAKIAKLMAEFLSEKYDQYPVKDTLSRHAASLLNNRK